MVRYRRKMGVNQLTDLKKEYDLVWREVGLFTTFAEFSILIKLFRLIKMCLNETCRLRRLRRSKPLSAAFSIQNSLKQENDVGLSVPVLLLAVRKAQGIRGTGVEWDTSASGPC
jgi:hypothetical protein